MLSLSRSLMMTTIPTTTRTTTTTSAATTLMMRNDRNDPNQFQLRVFLRISAILLLLISNAAIFLLYFWTTESTLLMNVTTNQQQPNFYSSTRSSTTSSGYSSLLSVNTADTTTSSVGSSLVGSSYAQSKKSAPVSAATTTTFVASSQLVSTGLSPSPPSFTSSSWENQLSQAIVITNQTEMIHWIKETTDLIDLAHVVWTNSWDLCYKYSSNPKKQILVNISFHCQDAFDHARYGTGNYVLIFHTLHLIAASAKNVDLLLSCSDALSTRHRLILPWMMGWFPYSSSTSQSSGSSSRTLPNTSIKESNNDTRSAISENISTSTTTPDNTRSHDSDEQEEEQQQPAPCSDIDMSRRWQNIQFDLRRMAIAMVGIPSTDHPSADWAEQYLWSTSTSKQESKQSKHTTTIRTDTTLHPNGAIIQAPNPMKYDPPFHPKMELDEAVLHFRCGDIINSNLTYYGFIKFESFAKYFYPNVTSIGIVTQPFILNANSRPKDIIGTERCKLVISELTMYLKERFPQSKVSVRNDPKEAITVAYARMVMAKQVVIAISSFGVFPAIATFGKAYIHRPDYHLAPNQWVMRSNITQYMNNVFLIDEPRLTAFQCQQMWKENGTEVLQWMKDYTMPPFNNNIEKETIK